MTDNYPNLPDDTDELLNLMRQQAGKPSRPVLDVEKINDLAMGGEIDAMVGSLRWIRGHLREMQIPKDYPQAIAILVKHTENIEVALQHLWAAYREVRGGIR